jgi:hypothetical protein
MTDLKVVLISQHVENGVFASVDNLELSIIYIALFASGLLEQQFIFNKCQNAPFKECCWPV